MSASSTIIRATTFPALFVLSVLMSVVAAWSSASRHYVYVSARYDVRAERPCVGTRPAQTQALHTCRRRRADARRTVSRLVMRSKTLVGCSGGFERLQVPRLRSVEADTVKRLVDFIKRDV